VTSYSSALPSPWLPSAAFQVSKKSPDVIKLTERFWGGRVWTGRWRYDPGD